LPPTTKRLVAIVETLNAVVPTLLENYLTVQGRELFYIILEQRVVVEAYRNMEISDIVKQLISRYAPELTTVNVVNTGITLEDIRFPYRTLKECLDTLADIAEFTYYCDTTLDLHWFKKGSVSSGLTFQNIRPTPSYTKDLIPVKNIVYVIGSVEQLENVVQNDYSGGFESEDTYWWAQSFTPTTPDLSQLSLYIKKVGIPPDNLIGSIREDVGGQPVGAIIKDFYFDREYVGAAAGWRPISIEEKLITGKKYWITIKKVGDVYNTYQWGKDASATGEHAYSEDGVNWTVVNSSFNFAFKTYYGRKIVAKASEASSVATYKKRETVFSDSSIRDLKTARRVAEAKLAELVATPTFLSTISVSDPTALPNPGESVNVQIPQFGVATTFRVQTITIKFPSGELGADYVEFQLGKPSEELKNVLADVIRDVKGVKVKLEGIDTSTLLNLLEYLFEATTFADEVVTLTKNAFKLDESALDGDDRIG
jgi:hypothetical protein